MIPYLKKELKFACGPVSGRVTTCELLWKNRKWVFCNSRCVWMWPITQGKLR